MQNIIIGKNCIENLTFVLKKNNASNILIFKGNSSYPTIVDEVCKDFTKTYCSNISANPKYEDIIIKTKEHHISDYDTIVAVGGGSVIDFAKAYKYYTDSSIPLIAIPTTAGTGSESTQFAVVYLNGEKTSLDTESILPNYVLYDSAFLASGSKYLKACTALDAFAQAIESFWAVGSTDESKKYAKEAIILIKESIIPFVLSNSEEINLTMAKAANLAGRAINISRTTAAHALSYTFTSIYNIPHGHAVALSIPDVFETNFCVTKDNCIDSRGEQYVKDTMNELLILLGLETNQFRKYWITLLKNIGIEFNLNKLSIFTTTKIIESVNLERLKNNPVDISKKVFTFWRN